MNQKEFDIRKEATDAYARIRGYIRETPLELSPYLSTSCDSQVYLKLENLQITGSFKLRGAMNKILSLNEHARQQGIVTASSGNHGSAVAYLLNHFNCRGTIYLPENAESTKVEALRLYGVDIQYYGTDCVQTEMHAKQMAAEYQQTFVSPYNDLQVIGGQGTVGIELERQLDKIDTVLIPVGGGGLISGMAGYLKSINENIKIVGCQPINSPVMYESMKAGQIVQMESKPTLSDGTAGGIEADSITFDICKKYVDDFILVSEDEIQAAVKLMIEKHHQLIEGSGGLSIASFLKAKERFEGAQVVLVISGAKIGMDQLRKIVCKGE